VLPQACNFNLTPTTGEYSFLVEAALGNQQLADKFARCCLLRDNGKRIQAIFAIGPAKKSLILPSLAGRAPTRSGHSCEVLLLKLKRKWPAVISVGTVMSLALWRGC
jgi:hypothetical protein